MAVNFGLPAGSPEWYLRTLVQQLVDRQARYDTNENYYLGTQPPPKGDPRYVQALQHYQKISQSNYISLVANAPVERMRITGFKFGPEPEPDQDAKLVWAANNMELQSKVLHSGAAIFGDCYALVGPIDDTTQYPTITVEDPRIAIVQPHPIFPTRSLAGLRMWQDVVTSQIVAVLYLPEQIFTYVARGYPKNNLLTKTEITNKLLSGSLSGGFELVNVQDNLLEEVPLVRFPWQPDFTDSSLAEAELVFNIQDRVNQMILDRLIIAKAAAYPQRYATGGVLPPKKAGDSPKKGPVQPPFEPGADKLWVVDNKETKFGEFTQVDFKQILEAVRDDIADIASITKTPAHYLMNRMVNVSGDTLTQSESGFVSKVMLRQEAMGWGWEQTLRLAFKYMGLAKATETEAFVMWAPPGVKRDADAADAAAKWAAIVSPELIMAHYGNFSADEISFNKKWLAEKQAQEQAQMDKQLAAKQTSGSPASGKTTKP